MEIFTRIRDPRWLAQHFSSNFWRKGGIFGNLLMRDQVNQLLHRPQFYHFRFHWPQLTYFPVGSNLVVPRQRGRNLPIIYSFGPKLDSSPRLLGPFNDNLCQPSPRVDAEPLKIPDNLIRSLKLYIETDLVRILHYLCSRIAGDCSKNLVLYQCKAS